MSLDISNIYSRECLDCRLVIEQSNVNSDIKQSKNKFAKDIKTLEVSRHFIHPLVDSEKVVLLGKLTR